MSEPEVILPPSHKTKVGVSKLIAQGVALAVAIVNRIWDLDLPWGEAEALAVIAILEGIFRGARHQEKKKVGRQLRAMNAQQQKGETQ